jgi:putative transposase
MALPRNKYVKDGQQGVYHCFSRCVRRAYLCGFDMLTGRDFSHRKERLVERLRFQASIFAVEVIAYAVMSNHYHTIVRTRPDIAAAWSDWDVAARWLMLFSKRAYETGESLLPTEDMIRVLANCPERIAKLRKRLSSLSWFIGKLNEFVARAANKEDDIKGRFWESRYKCQALLDESAIAACMVYVDLNPIRAGLANSPEESEFTSIQERICLWQKAMLAGDSHSLEASEDSKANISSDGFIITEFDASAKHSQSESWLCPIQSGLGRAGILQMSEAQYFALVDKSGRILHSDKPGTIDSELKPILLRISINPEVWTKTIMRFGSSFYLAAGLLPSLRRFADAVGRKWFKGLNSARLAFLL